VADLNIIETLDIEQIKDIENPFMSSLLVLVIQFITIFLGRYILIHYYLLYIDIKHI